MKQKKGGKLMSTYVIGIMVLGLFGLLVAMVLLFAHPDSRLNHGSRSPHHGDSLLNRYYLFPGGYGSTSFSVYQFVAAGANAAIARQFGRVLPAVLLSRRPLGVTWRKKGGRLWKIPC
jgi:hypothetical protein